MLLVTGGAGFIGSNFILDYLLRVDEPLVNLDALTYAGNMLNLATVNDDDRHVFIRGDIADLSLVSELLSTYRPRAIVHFAAESHVDRSIQGPGAFVQTNVNGTFMLLQAALWYWQELSGEERDQFRFIHISTDEVYGSLGLDDPPFTEQSRYAPNSPYAASKAASDHLVRSYHKTYDLPAIICNCSNNYGPYQFPEKLIPLFILNAYQGKPLPLYGNGLQQRDWLYVEDHCAALRLVLDKGIPGKTYLIGGGKSVPNLEVARAVCAELDLLDPSHSLECREQLITHVDDRPGHDLRYEVDYSHIEKELGWRPAIPFEQGLRTTVKWYLDNQEWAQKILTGEYVQWMNVNYGSRTGG